MKKLLISVAAIGLFALSAPAFAQPNNHGGPRPAPGNHNPGNHNPASRPGPSRPAQRPAPPPHRPAPPPHRPAPHPGPAARGHAAPRHDFRAYNRNFRAPRRFHAPAYRRPSGWYARRWVFGDILPSLFWTSNYWLNNYNIYGLAPPPPGTVWVRNGNDALLLERGTGRIIQVVYDVFY